MKQVCKSLLLVLFPVYFIILIYFLLDIIITSDADSRGMELGYPGLLSTYSLTKTTDTHRPRNYTRAYLGLHCNMAPNGYSLRVVGVPQSRGTVQIVSTYPASPEARVPSFFWKPVMRLCSMARGAPAPCGDIESIQDQNQH